MRRKGYKGGMSEENFYRYDFVYASLLPTQTLVIRLRADWYAMV